MLDFVRTSLHRAITTKAGDALLPIRLPKDVARRVNALLGEPLCSPGELARRRTAAARLEQLKNGAPGVSGLPRSSERPLAAPVVIYFEGDRNARLLGRIQETLEARNIPFSLMDVAGDQATMAFVLREARCKEDELPVVFVAGTAVGGWNELVDWDVSGRLAKAVYPPTV